MVAPIILYGSSVLRKHSVEITENDDIQGLSELLFDTLKKAKGIGLAGPQINQLKRIFVIDTSPLVGDDMTIERFEGVFINPIIIDKSTENEVYKEGCLSFPEIYEEVIRPEKVFVSYQDISFNSIENNFAGIKARIFQHEFDHLNGVLFIDKMGQIRRHLLKGKLNRIRKIYRYNNS